MYCETSQQVACCVTTQTQHNIRDNWHSAVKPQPKESAKERKSREGKKKKDRNKILAFLSILSGFKDSRG
jgi:hypothetical protein